MGAISKMDLKKPFHHNEHDGKYDDRGEYLLDLILQGKEIDLLGGKKVTVDIENSKDFIESLKSKNYNKLTNFTGTDGNNYRFSQIEKTKDFGSNKGMGGGSAQTSEQESSQCAVNALCYKLGRIISTNDLTEENIRSVEGDIDTTADINTIIEFCTKNKGWQNSLIESANLFYTQYKSHKFKFHRGSQLVANIYKAFKIAKKKSGLHLNDDKWNPSDIWAVSVSFGSKNFPTDIESLNKFIKELNINNELIGISLKKTGKDAKISIINDGHNFSQSYKINKIVSTHKSTNASLFLGDIRITFRTFNFATNFAGEIEGKNARHGKIGMGPLNNALTKNGEEPLPDAKKVLELIENKDKKTFQDFYTYYNDIIEQISYKTFLEKINNNNANWFVSKFLALKIVFIIKHSPQQNQILSYIMSFASSTTSDSSMFIKISESVGGVSYKPLAKFLKNPPKVSSLIKEHIKTGKPLIDTSWPKGSTEYLRLFKEARELYSRGAINVSNKNDLNLIKNTKLGELMEYKGKLVPLDYPLMENKNIYIYTWDSIDKNVVKTYLTESYDDRLFQIEIHIVLDKTEQDINETLSDIRAIEGVTVVNIEDVDELWNKDTQHSIKIKIKIDPSPFKSMNKDVFFKILKKIKILPGILRARFISKPKLV